MAADGMVMEKKKISHHFSSRLSFIMAIMTSHSSTSKSFQLNFNFWLSRVKKICRQAFYLHSSSHQIWAWVTIEKSAVQIDSKCCFMLVVMRMEIIFEVIC